MLRRTTLFLLLSISLFAHAEALAPIELTLIDDNATGYATFQSHNQKVVGNERGIFLTYIKSRNEAYTAQHWRLLWSQDEGATFHELYADTHATNPPVLETDKANNVYLAHPKFDTGEVLFYRFLAAEDYATPHMTTIPNAAAGKYSMVLNEESQECYFFSHNNTFHTISLDGTLESSIQLTKAGKEAGIQYPHIILSEKPGHLIALWTTQEHGRYMYRSIHAIQSHDFGKSWHALHNEKKLKLPVVVDEGGPSTLLSKTAEFDIHTWLCSATARAGFLHTMYLAQGTPSTFRYQSHRFAYPDQHIEHSPILQGDTLSIKGFDGFFITSPTPEQYKITAMSSNAGHLVALQSQCNGQNWKDLATSTQPFNVYSLGGYRHYHQDRYIIGTFTDQVGSNQAGKTDFKVYFFKIDGLPPSPK